jgi:monoamine oxidase
MQRSRKLAEFLKLVSATRLARDNRMTLNEVVHEAAERQSRAAEPSRRRFLKDLGAVAGTGLLLNSFPARAFGKQAPRIAIVGGGISGLNAALTLQDAGFASTIYEASSEVGGRIHSNATAWTDNQTSEWCGEFIDSGHTCMQALASRFGLTLVEELEAQPPQSTDTLFFFEQYYGVEQAFRDFQVIADRLEDDANNLFPTTFDPATHFPRSVDLDHMSAYDWIERNVPGGHRSPLGAYIDSAYTNEFGLDTDRQSALNVVYEMGFQPDPSDFSIYGESDQRFHVLGGNDQIPFAIAKALPKQSIETGWWMESIAKQSDGTFGLTFFTPHGIRYAIADHVILTIPFSVLRGLDYRRAGFDALKDTAIQHLGYGTNSKLIVQCTKRLWNEHGPWGEGDGSMYTDLFFQNAWDSSRGIPGNAGVLVAFMGGSVGLSLDGAHTPFASAETSLQVAKYAREFLQAANHPWPGIDSLWNGRATLSTPWKAPNLLGSYSCWKVGQYTTFSGYEGVRQGNCHFAGEHCSNSFQGFMEGGATEGARAAQEIISDLAGNP